MKVVLALALVSAFVFGFVWGTEWGGDAEAQTLPDTIVLPEPVVVAGSTVPCSAFDMSATGFWNACPDIRFVHDDGSTWHAMFYHNGGVDHFDPIITFNRSQGTPENPTQVQTGERTTPIAAYYYVGPTNKYQQLGALTWRNDGVGDCNGCLWGTLEIYGADYASCDPSTNTFCQRTAEIKGNGNIILRPGKSPQGDVFRSNDDDPAQGVFAQLADLQARMAVLEAP